MSAAPDREALRQQMLLRALLGDARPAVVAGWLRDGPRFARGFAAYQANAGALAERALAAAYPTLQQLLSEASFATLARVFWRRHPPRDGDIGRWGEALAAFLADDESLADEPYLSDVARLEWAVHQAERASDTGPPLGLERLAAEDPAVLCLQLAPGTAVVASPHPVVTLWQAHRSMDEDRFAPVRAAFAAGRGETGLIAREGWRAAVVVIAEPEAQFVRALLAQRSLSQALTVAGDAFDFESWLIAALRRGWLAGVTDAPPCPLHGDS